MNHKIINRHNLNPLKMRSLYATDQAVSALAKTANLLSVSQGSLVDTAIQVLCNAGSDTIIANLVKYNHLTEIELEELKSRIEA